MDISGPRLLAEGNTSQIIIILSSKVEIFNWQIWSHSIWSTQVSACDVREQVKIG